MKPFIKIAWLLFLPAFANAQLPQSKLVSLRNALTHAANDTNRMDICADISDFYSETNRDSSIYYMDQSLVIAKQLKLKLNEAIYLDATAYELMHLGNYPKSLQASLQALKIAEDPESEKYVWSPPAQRKLLYTRLDILAGIYHDLGHLYGATGNIDKQIVSYRKADSLAAVVKDSTLQALANMNLGSVYLEKNNLDSALLYEQTALKMFAALPFDARRYEGLVLNHLAEIYQKKGDTELSHNTFIKAIAVNIKQNNLSALGGSYALMGNLFKTINKSDSGIVYAKKAKDIIKDVNDLSSLAKVYNMLSSLFEQKNNKDSAIHYLKLAGSLKDSLDDTEKKNLQAYQNVGFDDQMRLEALEKEKTDRTKSIQLIFLCAFLLAAITVFTSTFIAYKREKKSKKIVNEQKGELETTLQELKSAQSQLIQSEKMASLGELTAGIAHEIQNPLNFVNNFSEINTELIDELADEAGKGNIEEIKIIANDIKENSLKINHHGKRADAIVKGMLQHSRQSSGTKEPTDINALADEYLRLSYHGLRAKEKQFNASLDTSYDPLIGNINIIPQDIGRVLLNLFNNAFYAVAEKQKTAGHDYQPTVSISTKKTANKIELAVSDNGNGIPAAIKEKIFQPFFTTKPTGQGTGLGLSLSYDIVKAHGGEIKVETKPARPGTDEEGEGTVFIIQLPI